MLLNFNDFEVGLGNTAVWVFPSLGYVSPWGTGRNAVFGAASHFAIYKDANEADTRLRGFFVDLMAKSGCGPGKTCLRRYQKRSKRK